jgi:acetyltransferase-like isoleucine patch superfamily enzyme
MFSVKKWLAWQIKLFFLRIKKNTKFKANWRSIVTNSIIGEYCDVGSSNLNQVQLGDYSYINSGRCSMAKIGKFCSIGQNTRIGSFATHPQYISTHPSFYHTNPQVGISFNVDTSHIDYKLIEIGHDVWIGDNVSIMDGVKIGTGSIIGTGTIIAKDIPPYSVVIGVPAKIIRKRFSDNEITALLDSHWWNFSSSKLTELGKLIGSDDVSTFLNQLKQSK